MPSKYDREYARDIPLPDWLKEFADSNLDKSGTTIEDIKNLFHTKNELDSVEARVEELRERVGLDAIEKTAAKQKELIPGGFAEGQPDEKYDKEQLGKGIGVEMEHTPDWEVAKEITKDHLEESEDFKDGEGGKYYDKLDKAEEEIKKEVDKKKALRIQRLITLADYLDEEGCVNGAKYIDTLIRKLADMERLPIMADPILWSDEQLLEVVNTPGLSEMAAKKQVPPSTAEGKEKSLLQAVVDEINKRNIAQGLKPPNVEAWRERGYWLLYGLNGQLLGIYNNDSKAQMAKSKLADMFAAGQSFNMIGGEYMPYLIQYIAEKALSAVAPEGDDDKREAFFFSAEAADIHDDAAEKARELLTDPGLARKRKEHAEKQIQIVKTPWHFEEYIDPKAIPEGQIPTDENADAAFESTKKFNLDPQNNELPIVRPNIHDTQRPGRKEFVKDYEREIVQKYRRKEKGLPTSKEESTDDGFELSCRHGFRLSKRAIKWYAPKETSPVVGPWQSYKLPPGAGTTLEPISEEEMWRREQAKKPQVVEPEPRETKEPEAEPEEEPESTMSSWYLMAAFGQGLGWFKEKQHAEDAKWAVVNQFSDLDIDKSGKSVLFNCFKDYLQNLWNRQITNSHVKTELINFVNSTTNQVYIDERDLAGQKAVQIYEIVEHAFAPRGGIYGEDEHPTGDYIDLAVIALKGLGSQYERTHPLYQVPADAEDAISASAENGERVIQEVIRWAERRAGHSATAPSYTDDNVIKAFYLSKRAKEKSIFEQFPKLETFVRNVCRSRGGYVELPAIQTMIRNERPENIDVHNKELVEFIKKCLKENKQEVQDDNTHDGEFVSEIRMYDDDGNRTVFYEPPSDII